MKKSEVRYLFPYLSSYRLIDDLPNTAPEECPSLHSHLLSDTNDHSFLLSQAGGVDSILSLLAPGYHTGILTPHD